MYPKGVRETIDGLPAFDFQEPFIKKLRVLRSWDRVSAEYFRRFVEATTRDNFAVDYRKELTNGSEGCGKRLLSTLNPDDETTLYVNINYLSVDSAFFSSIGLTRVSPYEIVGSEYRSGPGRCMTVRDAPSLETGQYFERHVTRQELEELGSYLTRNAGIEVPNL